mmetsp:Transcript_12050/g.36602  ORF Transcript_12050/g.36602 Transcript_12050/m.36602 type:complete len:200 (-) Transcript_12050:91-690(-)
MTPNLDTISALRPVAIMTGTRRCIILTASGRRPHRGGRTPRGLRGSSRPRRMTWRRAGPRVPWLREPSASRRPWAQGWRPRPRRQEGRHPPATRRIQTPPLLARPHRRPSRSSSSPSRRSQSVPIRALVGTRCRCTAVRSGARGRLAGWWAKPRQVARARRKRRRPRVFTDRAGRSRRRGGQRAPLLGPGHWTRRRRRR